MLTRLRLALALALFSCVSASALAADCVQGTGTGNRGQCYPAFVPIDPDSGLPSESARQLATSQVTADTTVKILCPARTGRRAVTVENLGTTPVTLGTVGVTATTGILLPGGAGQSITIPTSAAIYGLTGSGSQAVACLETY